jgi:hypothetical protein
MGLSPGVQSGLHRLGLHPELWAAWSPNGMAHQKPRHFKDMFRIARRQAGPSAGVKASQGPSAEPAARPPGSRRCNAIRVGRAPAASIANQAAAFGST